LACGQAVLAVADNHDLGVGRLRQVRTCQLTVIEAS
jgi:hypothetical protein